MAGFGLMLAGAAQGLGDTIVEQARAKRESALRQQEREQEREWQVEDRDLGYAEGRGREQRGFDREDASTNRAAGAMSGLYGSDLLGLIDATEGVGDHDTLFGHSQRDGNRFAGVRVSEMTLAELYEFSDPSGEYGQWVRSENPEGVVATPMGRFQIVGTTLRSAARELGLDPSTRFTPEVQSQIAMHLADRRLASAGSIEAKREAMRNEWAGFRNIDDATLDAAIRQYEAGPDAFAAMVDPNVPADARQRISNGLGTNPQAEAGAVETAQPEPAEPVEAANLSAGLDTRLRRNALLNGGGLETDEQLLLEVKSEIVRLMTEEGLNESQAEVAALQAMQFDNDPAPNPRGGLAPGARDAAFGPRTTPGTGTFTGFNYGDEPEPDRSQPQTAPNMPSEPDTPSLPQSGGLPQPSTEAEMLALPPGTRYRAPDGTVRIRS